MRHFDNVNYNAPPSFKRIYDVRLVRTLEASVRASARSGHRELVDRLRGVLFPYSLPAKDYSGMSYAIGLRRICVLLSRRDDTMELRHLVSVHFFGGTVWFLGTALRQRKARPKSSLFHVQRIIPGPALNF